MTGTMKRALVQEALERGGGVLRLAPAWVARDFLPPGKRLGLRDDEYNVGDRGWICERWIGSTTRADNRVGPPDEGLSHLVLDGQDLTLSDAIETAGDLIMGVEYARTHDRLGRLPKIFDYGARLPFHVHQRKKDAAKLGRNPKEEAYYFPEGVDLGPHPETFFGVHPYIVAEGKQLILAQYLKEWKDDLILQHSRAYLNVRGEGFHLPAGVLHAPGTALTIELQEDSDVFAMLQALNAGNIISKELLFKDVTLEDRATKGELAVLEQVDWETSSDPFFYENRHTPPVPVGETRQAGGQEDWIFYNTTKFSGKRLAVRPGQAFHSVDRGVYNILVWRGKGFFGDLEVEGLNFDRDELLISHDAAVRPIVVENTGAEDLIIFKFFGPDINLDVPFIAPFGE
jgi:hypothetical protein